MTHGSNSRPIRGVGPNSACGLVADALIACYFGTCCVYAFAVYALWVAVASAYAGQYGQYVDMPGCVCDDISGFTVILS